MNKNDNQGGYSMESDHIIRRSELPREASGVQLSYYGQEKVVERWRVDVGAFRVSSSESPFLQELKQAVVSFLFKLGVIERISSLKEEEKRVSNIRNIVLDLSRFSMELREIWNHMMYQGIEIDYVIIGRDVYSKIASSLGPCPIICIEASGSILSLREPSTGIRILVIPWYEGILLVPKVS